MQCPHCGLENISSAIYCEQCGTPLNIPSYTPESHETQIDYSEYDAPPPPPLNGNATPPKYNELLSPPPPPVEQGLYSMQPQAFTHGKITSGLGIFNAILYFTGALIAAFGLLGTIANFSGESLNRSVGLLLSIALLLASILVFIRIRRRFTILRWWQRILSILGATVAGFIALVIVTIIAPNQSATTFATGFAFILYGLVWAAIAVW